MPIYYIVLSSGWPGPVVLYGVAVWGVINLIELLSWYALRELIQCILGTQYGFSHFLSQRYIFSYLAN